MVRNGDSVKNVRRLGLIYSRGMLSLSTTSACATNTAMVLLSINMKQISGMQWRSSQDMCAIKLS